MTAKTSTTIRVRCPKCSSQFDTSTRSDQALCQICGTLSERVACEKAAMIADWADRDRAEYIAAQKFYDFGGNEISREEAVRLANEPIRNIDKAKMLDTVTIDRAVLAEVIEALADLDYQLRKFSAYGEPIGAEGEAIARGARARDALRKATGK